MYKIGIITASDTCFKGNRVDKSGELVKEIVEKNGYEVEKYCVLPDEKEKIAEELIYMADVLQVSLILTTGGTGFSPRDITPEATKLVLEREALGISEAMRINSLSITKRAMLSRGISGIRGRTVIVNLPGSPKAVSESLEFIIAELEHGIQILRQEDSECAR